MPNLITHCAGRYDRPANVDSTVRDERSRFLVGERGSGAQLDLGRARSDPRRSFFGTDDMSAQTLSDFNRLPQRTYADLQKLWADEPVAAAQWARHVADTMPN